MWVALYGWIFCWLHLSNHLLGFKMSCWTIFWCLVIHPTPLDTFLLYPPQQLHIHLHVHSPTSPLLRGRLQSCAHLNTTPPDLCTTWISVCLSPPVLGRLTRQISIPLPPSYYFTCTISPISRSPPCRHWLKNPRAPSPLHRFSFLCKLIVFLFLFFIFYIVSYPWLCECVRNLPRNII